MTIVLNDNEKLVMTIEATIISYIGTSKQKTESLTERMCGWST